MILEKGPEEEDMVMIEEDAEEFPGILSAAIPPEMEGMRLDAILCALFPYPVLLAKPD